MAGLPEKPGVYAFRDANGRLLYVGKAVNLKRRVRSYFGPGGGHSDMTRRLKDVAAYIEHWEVGSELEALLAEARAIQAGSPLFNIMGMRPGGPAFVRVTNEAVPRVLFTRKLTPDGSRHYGPFRPARALRSALDALQPVLKWRLCKDTSGERCLYHQTGRCLAPCVAGAGTVSETYREMLDTLDRLFTGRDAEVRQELERRMRAEAEALRFERAAALRDSLAAISRLVARAEALTQDGVLVEPWPGGEAGARLLAIRSGRLVLARDVRGGASGTASDVWSFLEEVWRARGPGPARTADELREVDSICRYLLRRDDRWVRVSRRRLDAAQRELCRRLGAEAPPRVAAPTPTVVARRAAPQARPPAQAAPRASGEPATPPPAPLRSPPSHSARPFVAIDFETADGGSDSACAVALVRVEADGSRATVSRLIRPPRRRIRFTYIHGIRWEDVADCPSFGAVWSELAPLLDGAAFLAAHNASFDRGVLLACCQAARLPPPDLPFVCTVSLARRAWAIRPTKLNNVCDRLGIPLSHHDPVSDAEACAEIVVRAAAQLAGVGHDG